MQLKPATVDDLVVLTQWYKDLRTDEKIDNQMTDEEIKQQMESFLRSTTYKTYFLEIDHSRVGYGMIDITRNPKYLRHLFIERPYRQKGYGKKLINLLMELYGIAEIDIDVMVWNDNALAFYRQLGFKPRYYGMRLKR